MSGLRIGVLTTDTAHHRYFLQRLYAEVPDGVQIVFNIFERKLYPFKKKARRHFLTSLPNVWRGIVGNPYRQSKIQTKKQARYEEPRFFPSLDRTVPDAVPTYDVFSANDQDALSIVQRATPDVLLVYGTGKLQSPIFETAPLGAINAHGGLLPEYRGLDTNLWAALENRPNDMAVAIHQIDATLDTGSIFVMQRLSPQRDMCLASLRYHTTILSTNLFLQVIRDLAQGKARSIPQTGASGRYYGPMPLALKRRADRILRAYSDRAITA